MSAPLRFHVALLFIALSLLAGCSSDTPTSAGDAPGGSLEKQDEAGTPSRDFLPILIDNLLLQPMPVATSPKIRENAVVVVTPQAGGQLTAKLTYNAFLGRKVSVISTLSIPPGAVTEDVTITMAIDDVTAGVRFEPEGLQFRKTVLLDYQSAGLTILGPLVMSMNFFYVNPNGPCELIPNSGIAINLLKGSIKLEDARLNHFSAYAFGRVY